MITVGLTGNLGSGKSTVARMLAELGADVVDADRLVHEMLAPGGDAVAQVLAAFPVAAASDGGVDRRALGAIVFAHPERRQELERILHPLVITRTDELAEEARERGASMLVADAPLLFEAWRAGHAPDPRQRFDAIVVVTCAPAARRARLRARELLAGRTPDEADLERRLAAQMPEQEKAALADEVVDNSGDLESTRERVRMVHSRLLSRAERPSRNS